MNLTMNTKCDLTNALFFTHLQDNLCGHVKSAVWSQLPGICCFSILGRPTGISGVVIHIHVHTKIAHVHLIHGVNY